MLAAGSADPADPACAAHLHCPPLAVAVAADAAVSALNPSLDSWDQAPAASAVEEHVLGRARRTRGLLARGGPGRVHHRRDRVEPDGAAVRPQQAGRRPGADVAGVGVHRLVERVGRGGASSARRSRTSRCSGRRRCSASASSPSSRSRRRRAADAAGGSARRRCSTRRRRTGCVPSPSSPPRAPPTSAASTRCPRSCEVVPRRRTSPVWLHVDAAYGGGALFSDRLRGLLDRHRAGRFGQPRPAQVRLAAGRRRCVPHRATAPPGAASNGRSPTSTPPTTPRPAPRPARSLAADHPPPGRVQDRRHAAGARPPRPRRSGRPLPLPSPSTPRTASSRPRLELAARPTLSTVVFRYRPAAGPVGRPGQRRASGDGC